MGTAVTWVLERTSALWRLLVGAESRPLVPGLPVCQKVVESPFCRSMKSLAA